MRCAGRAGCTTWTGGGVLWGGRQECQWVQSPTQPGSGGWFCCGGSKTRQTKNIWRQWGKFEKFSGIQGSAIIFSGVEGITSRVKHCGKIIQRDFTTRPDFVVVSCNVCWKFTLPASRRNEERTHSNSIMQIQWRRLRRTTLQLHDAHNYQNHSNSTICLPEPSVTFWFTQAEYVNRKTSAHISRTQASYRDSDSQQKNPKADTTFRCLHCRNSKKETNKNHIMQLRSPSSFTHALYTLKCFAHRRAMNGSW